MNARKLVNHNIVIILSIGFEKIFNIKTTIFKFFTKAMNSIMEHVDAPISIKSKLPKEIDDNFNTIFNLSKDMGVDLEFIKGYYCCMLYAFDYHNEAEKVRESFILNNHLFDLLIKFS